MKSKMLDFRTWFSVFAIFVLGGFLFSPGGPILSPAGAGEAQTVDKPRLVISPAEVEYKSKVAVMFSGSGFKPKQELGIEVELGGAASDVSWLMEPKPVPDERGAFSSKWVLNDEIRRKLFEPKTYTVEVVDAEGTVLAQASLAFRKADEKAEKKK